MTAIESDLMRPAPVTHRILPRTAEIASVLLLVFTLRLPSLFEPHHYGDEGVFAATAQQVLAGETLYTHVWDNKPPLVFIVYATVIAAVGPSMAALHLTGAIWSAATALIVLAIGRRTGDEATAWLAALLYAVLASMPMIEGTLLLTEHLMALPAALAVLLALRGTVRRGRRRDRLIAGAGISLGVAFLFKQVALVDAAAIGLWLVCLRGRPVRDAAVLVLGWVAPVAVVGTWLAASGAFRAAWEALAGSYGIYLGEGSVLPMGFQILRLLPAAVAIAWLLWQRRRRQVNGNDLMLLWLGFTVLGATTGGRPFGHYLVQVLAPLVLVATSNRTWFATLTSGTKRVRLLVLVLSLVTILAGFRGFWFSHPTLTPDYYGNWIGWVAGGKTRDEHDRFFSWRVSNQQGLIRAIEADGDDQTLFIWGEYPWLYALLDAKNPAPFTTAYQTTILPGAKEETMRALEHDPPRYVVQELEEWRRLPGLAEFLAAHYEPMIQIDNTVLWRRLE